MAFARMCMSNPNFLVLDEPTNHLDIETIEALGKAIQKYTVSIEYYYFTVLRSKQIILVEYFDEYLYILILIYSVTTHSVLIHSMFNLCFSRS